MAKKITINVLVIVLLIIIFLLNILSIRDKSVTYDEPRHLRYGEQILMFNADRFLEAAKTPHVNHGVMPITCLNAIPQKIGKSLQPGKLKNFLDNLNTGRSITVIFSVLLAFFIFKWASELYGTVSGLFSLTLYAFSPNIIAHSRLITTDLYAPCLITISTYYFGQFIKFGGWKKVTISASILGLGQITKYSCALLYPIFTLIVIIRYSKRISRLLRIRDFATFAKWIKSFLKFALLFILIGMIFINLGFLFYKSFTPLGKHTFDSSILKSIQSKLSLLRHLPIPLPYPYLQGYDGHAHKQETTPSHGRLYLRGNLRRSPAFKGYYFVASLYKVPIAIQILILLSGLHYVWNRRKYDFLNNELFLLAPVAFFSVYLNFIFSMNIGIRHAVIIFPFLYIFCGSLIRDWRSYSIKSRAVIIFLLIYLIISVLSYFPHYLSYFNELVWDRKQAYKILADSNIDWGQNKIYLNKYKSENPHVHINPESPISGTVVVSVNYLVGVTTNDPDKYRWLRDNFNPVGHIGYSYLIYDIPPDYR
jgi:Dolichyl-phosphate-mannose-protein mannosyltransferase